MITYILALVSALSLLPHHAISKVDFKEQTIKATLAQAKSEQKLILRVCSSEQCHWCRWMDKNVWNDISISHSINNKLIPIEPAFDRMEFMQNCQTLPSMFFLDENGNTVLKVNGKKTLEEMKAIVNQVLSTNCTGKGEKLDEALGTHKGSSCCDGLVKEEKDGAGFCMAPACIETSSTGIPLSTHPRNTPPCCDDSAEKEMTFGTIGSSERVRCVEQRIFKKINQGSRDFKKPNFFPDSKKEKSGSGGKPY
jgi:thioredoxin-related protein